MERRKMITALFSVLALLAAGCSREAYEWTTTVGGEARRALIWPSTRASVEAPVVVYFHGRGGDAEDSQQRRGFHELWPEAVVAYAEGTNHDGRTDGSLAWQIRFPHVFSACGLKKDFDYVTELLKHVEDTWNVDSDRIFFSGHSSGGFFTLSLSQLMSERVAAVAALGAYTSFAPLPTAFDCTDTYTDGIVPGVTLGDLAITANPVPTFLLFGDDEDTIRDNSIVYDPDCGTWSYFQNSVYQIARKNSSSNPPCTPTESFMSDYSPQVLPGIGPGSAETRIRLYDGPHSWPSAANQWVIDYFKSFD